MEIELLDDRMARLVDSGLHGIWLVNVELTNLDDLIDWTPGRIVRVENVHDAVKFIPHDTQGLEGCVAGWISEEDEASRG